MERVQGMKSMEISIAEFLTEEFDATDGDLLKEAWPIAPEEYIREFEEYLLEIGVRI